MEKQLLTARDVADALGHKETAHVYALIRAGQLPAVKVGSRGVRIPKAAFDDYLAALNAAAKASLNLETFAAAFQASGFQASGSILADILAPSAERQAADKSRMDGFLLGLKNAAPRR